MNLVLLYQINNGNWIHVCEYQSAYVPRGGSRTSTAGGGEGAQVTNEAEAGGVRKILRNLHQNGAFWMHFEVINSRF